MAKKANLMIDVGEAVGIVAAQSIGEPGTQMSLPYGELVVVDRGNGPEPVRIGELVDSLIARYGADKSGDSEVCALPAEENLLVPSLTHEGKVEWKRVLECSRHMCGRRLVRIRTRSGRTITATENHSFVIRKGNAIVPVAACELKRGMCIPSVKRLPLPKSGPAPKLAEGQEEPLFGCVGCTVPVWHGQPMESPLGAYTGCEGNGPARISEQAQLSEELGLAIGAYLSEGNRAKPKASSEPFAHMCSGGSGKRVPPFAYGTSEEFIGALLRGYFEGAGNVSVAQKAITVSSRSPELIDGIALLAARLGIFALKAKGKKNALIIPYHYADAFRRMVGFGSAEKRKALDELCAIAAKEKACDSGKATRSCDEDVVWDEIAELEYLPPSDGFVYDFSVEGLETFMTFEGIMTHNTMRTFHYAGVAEQVPTGLPRLIEIVDVRREPKKPLMNIYLKGEYAKDESKAKEVAERIEEVNLSKIATIRENFEKKEIEVEIHPELIKYEGLSFEDVLKRLKSSGVGKVEQMSETMILIKPKSTLLRSIRKTTERLSELHLKGVKGINRAIVMHENDEYFIRTGGSNLAEIMKLPEVDASRVYTNNIKEIESVLGIEAARNAIVFEAKQVLDMQKLDVDVRHINLLADAMCMDGVVKPVGRHGLSGEKASIFARAAFEETIKHLINASIKGEEENFVGVTENIIIGQPVPVGTGTVKLGMPRHKK